MPQHRRRSPSASRPSPPPTPAQAAERDALVDRILDRIGAIAEADLAADRARGVPDPTPEEGAEAIAALRALIAECHDRNPPPPDVEASPPRRARRDRSARAG